MYLYLLLVLVRCFILHKCRKEDTPKTSMSNPVSLRLPAVFQFYLQQSKQTMTGSAKSKTAFRHQREETARCAFIGGLFIIMRPFQVTLGGRAVSHRLGDSLLPRLSRRHNKPVPGDIQDVQFCRLRELRWNLHQPVLPHTENVQTSAAANLQHGEDSRMRLDVTHSARQVKKRKTRLFAHLGFSSIRTKGPE